MNEICLDEIKIWIKKRCEDYRAILAIDDKSLISYWYIDDSISEFQVLTKIREWPNSCTSLNSSKFAYNLNKS